MGRTPALRKGSERTSQNSDKKLSEKTHERAKRLTISRLIAT